MTTTFRSKLSYALSLAIVLALLLAPLALADNIVNDVSGSAKTETIVAGNSTVVAYRIIANNGDDQNGCNASDSTPATVTINPPDGVTVTPASLVFTLCGVWKEVTFSSSSPGSYVVTVSVSDSGTGTYNTDPAKFTLVVQAPPDTTPPVITPNIVGTLGNDGWYTSDVTVSWSVVDEESQITSISGCDATTISEDTAGVTLTCSATSTGGTASASVIIKLDATPPEVSLVGELLNFAEYFFGDTPAEPTCTASDAMSGLDGDCIVEGFSEDVGSHTVTATAKDVAGNTASDSFSYIVKPWTLSGFYAPVDMGGVFNTVKGGSTVPLKFEVFKGAEELTDTAIIKTFVQVTLCDATASLDEIESYATGGTSLRYDFVEGQFIFNWQTPKKPGTCYQVIMTTLDGSSISANFKLK